MSHDGGWRGSCAAGDVTDVVVGSGALLGAWSVPVCVGLGDLANATFDIELNFERSIAFGVREDLPAVSSIELLGGFAQQ